MKMKGYVSILSCVFLMLLCIKGEAFCATSSVFMDNYDSYTVKEKDLSALFGKYTGTAVIFNPGKQEFIIYNDALARQRFSPFSSFKIVSAMLGLEYGVVEDAKSTMHYTGTRYWHEAWNHDVDFKHAFQHSCVWYFHQIINEIPQNKVREALQALHYGNADVSEWQGNGSNKHEELNGFWLNSSLRISPLEQVKVMYSLFSMGSAYTAEHRELVASFMQLGHGSIYGKTGSDGKGQSWFVGFIKKGLYKDYFAFYVKDADDAMPHAKNIALEFLKDY